MPDNIAADLSTTLGASVADWTPTVGEGRSQAFEPRHSTRIQVNTRPPRHVQRDSIVTYQLQFATNGKFGNLYYSSAMRLRPVWRTGASKEVLMRRLHRYVTNACLDKRDETRVKQLYESTMPPPPHVLSRHSKRLTCPSNEVRHHVRNAHEEQKNRHRGFSQKK